MSDAPSVHLIASRHIITTLRAMNDVSIPTYRDLMYPTLVAVKQLGGSASISELEETVPQIATVSDEQLAVEYPERVQTNRDSRR